ANSRWQDTRL
nr:Chain B, iCAL36-QDTRL peptide [synthetic construct]4K78_B Chain B, iCAL36-QDTRL peptide [synthetic construct]